MSSLDETRSEKICNRSRSEIEREVFYRFKMKYQSNEYTYSMKITNDLIFNERSKIVSTFKDFLIYDDSTEFLKRFYDHSQNTHRLSRILQFYEMYSKIFPNYISLPERDYLYKNIRKKQKMIDNFNKMKQIKQKEETFSYEQNQKNEENFFNTQIELSINKFKPCLNYKESQLQNSLVSINDYNNNINLNPVNSNYYAPVLNTENEESFVSIKSLLKVFNKKEVYKPLISDIKIKQIFDNKSKFLKNLNKDNSENPKIQKLKYKLQSKNTEYSQKLNLKNYHNEVNNYKSNEKSPILIKSEYTNSNQNSINQIVKNNKLLSEKINQKLLVQKILDNKVNSNLETKSQISNQEDIIQNNFLKDKKKIIHRISSSIPDLKNYKINSNNANIIIPNGETPLNINQNFNKCENRSNDANRIIIVENLNIYNNSNYYSNDSFKRSSNNFVKNIQNLKNFNSSVSRVNNFNSPYSSSIQKRTPSYTETNKYENFFKNSNSKNTQLRDFQRKYDGVDNFGRKDEILKTEKVKLSSRKSFSKLLSPKTEERSNLKTLTNSTSKSKNIGKFFREVKEIDDNSSAKLNERLVKNFIKKNSKNNLMTNSISKMKEIKNASLTARNSWEFISIPIKILNTEIIDEKFNKNKLEENLKSNVNYKNASNNKTSTPNSVYKSLKLNINNLNHMKMNNYVTPNKAHINQHELLTTNFKFTEKDLVEIRNFTTDAISRDKSNDIKVVQTEPYRKAIPTESNIKFVATKKLNVKTIINKPSMNLFSSIKNRTPSTSLCNKIDSKKFKAK